MRTVITASKLRYCLIEYISQGQNSINDEGGCIGRSRSVLSVLFRSLCLNSAMEISVALVATRLLSDSYQSHVRINQCRVKFTVEKVNVAPGFVRRQPGHCPLFSVYC